MNLVAIHPSLQTLDYVARSILELREMNELVHHLAEIQVVWKQSFTVFEELRKQIIHVEICINLDLLWHEVKPTLVWGAMLGRYKVFTPKPTNKAELKSVLEAIWEDLPQGAIDLAVLGSRKRLQACIRAGGGHFEHLLK